MRCKEEAKKSIGIKCETNDSCIACFLWNLYDSDGVKVYSNKFKNSVLSKTNITKPGIYKFEIISFDKYSPRVAYRWVRLSPCRSNIQSFKFMHNMKTPRKVWTNFKLTEARYTNFPINKGVLTLCPI